MMYNYTTTALALDARMKILSYDAGEYLSNEMQSKIHTTSFKQAYIMIDDLFNELEAKEKSTLVEPWLAHIRTLEKKVEALEAKLEESTNHVTGLESKLNEKLKAPAVTNIEVPSSSKKPIAKPIAKQPLQVNPKSHTVS